MVPTRALAVLALTLPVVGVVAAQAAGPRIERSPSRAYACVDCHTDAHPGFAESGHALAASEPFYALSLRTTPAGLKAACASCHAPELAPAAAERGEAGAGVTCVSCHLQGGAVRVSHDRPLQAPHPTRYDPALCDGSLCASCHRVELPLGKDGAMLTLQDTPSEHAAWRLATGERRGCVDCHIRDAAMDFAGVRDPAMRERALRIALRFEARGEAILEVENLTGHAFPTGSQLREAWLRVSLVGPHGAEEVLLLERISMRGDPAQGEVVQDRRLAPGETRAFRLALPASASAQAHLVARVDLAWVSLDFQDDHPIIPPGVPRTVPVLEARFDLPED